jgi:hypothetical protein
MDGAAKGKSTFVSRYHLLAPNEAAASRTDSGKQLELGLRNYPMVSLAEARRIAAENKALAQRGVNPKLERFKPKTIPPFKEVMEFALNRI